jgi:hypothetical protein
VLAVVGEGLGCADVSESGYVGGRLINTALVAPAGVGGNGAGASIFRTARNNTLMLHAIPVTICLRYALGRRGEANAGRAQYAALFHHCLHFT